MKIALCSPADIHSLARFNGQSIEGVVPGLGSTVATSLIIELLGRGHEVTVYTLSRSLLGEKYYQWRNLRIFAGPYRQSHLARNYYRPEIQYLRRIIEKDAPEFIHAHWTYEFALGALRTGIQTVTTIHDLPWNVLAHFRDPFRVMRLLMAYEVAARGKHFTAVSKHAASHFHRYFNPRAEIRIIPNGLPDTIFELGAHSLRGERKEIVFATILQGWSRLKNAATALRAFQIVRNEIPDARLEMYGTDYEQNGKAHQWATLHHLSDGVTFAGSLLYGELLKRVNHSVDVIVHPSLHESFSMTALEGLALGKVVIASKEAPALREMLRDGKSGVLVDVRKPVAIADAMTKAARDRDYRIGIGENAYAWASARYRLSDVMSQYEGLYSNMSLS